MKSQQAKLLKYNYSSLERGTLYGIEVNQGVKSIGVHSKIKNYQFIPARSILIDWTTCPLESRTLNSQEKLEPGNILNYHRYKVY